MSSIAQLAVTIVGLLALLVGCQSSQVSTESNAGDLIEAPVGNNLVGESCHAQTTASTTIPAVTESAVNVYCGRWEHPSGRVYKVGDTSLSFDEWAKDGWWRKELDRQMTCDSQEESSILGDIHTALLSCRLNNGGWPYLALIARVDRSTYLADGIPAALPAIENTIGILSGRLDETSLGDAAVRSAAIRRIEAKLKGRLYGTGDLQTYYQLMTLGQYYNSVKDYATAERQYREALTIHERLLGVGNSGTADPMMHLALELSNRERFLEAEALFQRVSTMLEHSLDNANYARYVSYRAYHAANQRRFDEALRLARQATEIRTFLDSSLALQAPPAGPAGEEATSLAVREADVEILTIGGATPSTVDIVQSLYLEAAMRDRLGEPENSENVLVAARSILYSADQAPPNWEPQLLGLSGRIAKSRGRKFEAENSFQSAATLWEERLPGERPTAIAYFELAKAYRGDGRIEEALDAFRKAVEIVKSRSASLGISQVTPYLDTALEAAGMWPERRQDLAIEMFNAAQLVRSSATSHNIALAAARLAENENEVGRIIRELQEAEDQRLMIERQYQSEVTRIDQPEHHERLNAITDQIVATNQRIQKLSAQVQAASPGYNQLIDSVTTMDRVVELLGPNEALMQVLLGDNRSYGFFFRGGRMIAYAMHLSAADAAFTVSRLRQAFLQSPTGGYPVFDVATAHALYERLFAPISDEMHGVSHLITVPSGPLLSLPFGLLITEPPPAVRQNDYTRVKWLAQQTAISLVPSVRSFVDLRAVAQPSSAPKSFIGFGDFVPYGVDTIVPPESALPEECRADSKQVEKYLQMVQSLGALPYTQIEVKAVASTFPKESTRIFLKQDFNEHTVKTSPLHDYRIVYFATHALLPYEIQCQPEPSLIASLPAGGSGDANGFIELGEILKLQLNADLVVLSACNTGGSGLQTGGESLSGLARAFFFSGARSLLVSHWAVQDQPTTIIMINMFKQLQTHRELGIAGALQRSQIRILDESRKPGRQYLSHPLYWAAFSLVGDGRKSVANI